jgi:hypothetical protein
VLHSTIDTYAPESATVVDYKTFTNEGDLKSYRQPHKRAQLLTYAVQLFAKGKRVKHLMFVGERWDSAREELLGYDKVIVPITNADLAMHMAHMKQLAVRLRSAIEVLREEQEVIDVDV